MLRARCRAVVGCALVGALAGCVLDRAALGGDVDSGSIDAGRPAIDARPPMLIDARSTLDAPPAVDAPPAIDAPLAVDAGACVPAPPIDALHAAPAIGVTLDGDLGDWTDARFVHVARWVGPGSPSPTDFDVRVAAAWEPAALLFAVEVTDDVHTNDRTDPALLYQGDSAQLAFDVGDNAAPGGYDTTDDFEYGWALAAGATVRYRWVAPALAPAATDTVAITRSAGRTRYEIRIPASDLRVARFESGATLRTSLMVSDNDGGPRDGYVEWGSGIGGPKDPRAFRTLTIGPPICP